MAKMSPLQCRKLALESMKWRAATNPNTSMCQGSSFSHRLYFCSSCNDLFIHFFSPLLVVFRCSSMSRGTTMSNVLHHIVMRQQHPLATYGRKRFPEMVPKHDSLLQQQAAWSCIRSRGTQVFGLFLIGRFRLQRAYHSLQSSSKAFRALKPVQCYTFVCKYR